VEERIGYRKIAIKSDLCVQSHGFYFVVEEE
jgi:hypothetical protein